MKTFIVDLAERSYPIYIGRGLLENSNWQDILCSRSQILIVTNVTIARFYLDKLHKVLLSANNKLQIDDVLLPDGEQYKNWQTLNLVYDKLLENKHERGTLLIALGGGVVGDMTGFAAATYQRGVDFIQVPTTLLSQVDSSVGGKTGINHPLGKNMVGAFYQPKCVIIDVDSLQTLPDRELSAGLAEIIKYGLIMDEEFFLWLEENIGALMQRDPEALGYAIERSCADKAAIVSADEKESGNRALLNFGHTFGHAIEAHQGYGNWLHGEAVATGMVIAAEFSQELGWLKPDQVVRIRKLLEKASLPVKVPAAMTTEDFFEKMQVDKKVQRGKIRYVLLKAIGDAVIKGDLTDAKVSVAINRCRD